MIGKSRKFLSSFTTRNTSTQCLEANWQAYVGDDIEEEDWEEELEEEEGRMPRGGRNGNRGGMWRPLPRA